MRLAGDYAAGVRSASWNWHDSGLTARWLSLKARTAPLCHCLHFSSQGFWEVVRGLPNDRQVFTILFVVRAD